MDPNVIEVVNGENSESVHFLIENWLTILFGVISCIGMLIGYISWKSSGRQKKVYGYLFNLAEKSLDKEETERTLAQRKEEVKLVSDRIQLLQERIREDIPKEAQRTVLKDRFDYEVTILKQLYSSATQIRDDLLQLGESPEIPPEIRKFIEKEISPEYMLREKRSNLKTYLSVTMAAAAILPVILPNEFSWIAGRVLFLVGIIIAFVLLATLPVGLKVRRKSKHFFIARRGDQKSRTSGEFKE